MPNHFSSIFFILSQYHSTQPSLTALYWSSGTPVCVNFSLVPLSDFSRSKVTVE